MKRLNVNSVRALLGVWMWSAACWNGFQSGYASDREGPASASSPVKGLPLERAEPAGEDEAKGDPHEAAANPRPGRIAHDPADIPKPDRFVGTDEEHIAHMNNLVKQSMMDRNVPKHMALAVLEKTHGEAVPEAGNLDDWLSVYDGTLYTPPYEFDFTDPKDDYSTIPFAIHSYWHAMNSGRVDSLLKHCVEEFREDLVSYFKIDPGKRKSYTSENSFFRVLLSGSTKIDGETYYVCLYYRRRRDQPEDAILGYYEHHFVKKGEAFHFTGAPRFTSFGMVFDFFAGSDPLKLGKYSKLVPELKKAGMPSVLLPEESGRSEGAGENQ